ncbi:hypothetical protein Cri9333_0365 [Crinalium epipsammum PCC 9333]|uniref:Zinc finger CHC2-type domain-containing protein n=1 Tax=Crinalium epipsammum PCC 9333 TaxID=1173022 RepID=K9VVZ6_9CYAN|nr:CHC2 zinc finger domain-containing protein [Crinalium epipsammum]AFZ11345.1 hypothetical protein Cri9333_0365 [Crinalium epipsammum PCC 9333]
MSKFIPTRRGNNCPICGDYSGDCRIVGEVVLCHSSVDTDALVAGWRYLHADKSGVWGVYVPDTGSEGKSWQDIAEQRNQRRQLEREQLTAKSLPARERNQQYRAIAKQLNLSRKHRQHLLEHRGLTQSEIDLAVSQGWLRTWIPGQEVFGASPNLAGINPNGKHTLLGVSGISIAALDINGCIVGHQIASDEREKFAKYIWLSSASRSGSSPHLPNGELPLFIWKHPLSASISEVHYCEGSLKSLLVALKLWSQGRTDIVVVGASGGNFASSPQILKTIQSISTKKQCLLYPDAGAIANRQIMLQYSSLYTLLHSSGYELQVAWWGQFTKDDSDIDELPDTATFELITHAQFEALAIVKTEVHNDFCVSDSKQSYYCFHCQTGGNTIKFLMDFDKKSFTDVVLGLAQKHQIPVEWDVENPKRLSLLTVKFVKAKTDIYKIISERIPLHQYGKDYRGACPFHNQKATPFDSISTLFKNLKTKLDNTFRGFGKSFVKPITKPKPQEVKINIPTPSAYQKLGHPHIIYDGDILKTWQKASELGYKAVLDKSATGVGKSHAAGDALPSCFGVDKIFYLAADHTNPTTLSVEVNFGNVLPRNNGFKEDESRLTPLGHPFKVHPKKDEQPDTPGNCYRAPLFHTLAGKNLSGIEQSNESPICATCDLAGACKNSKGNGYGFRAERSVAFSYDRLRAHPDSMPNTKESEYEKWMGIWDEAGRLIKSTKLIDVKLADFDKTWAELEAKLPQHHTTLTYLRRSLRSFLTGELKQPYHGWNDAEIRERLPPAPDNILLLADEIENELSPEIDKILKQSDSVDFRGNAGKGVSKATRSLIRSTLRKEAYTESSKNLDSVLLNWLPQFLRIWGGEKGAFRCQWSVLTIANRDKKHADIVKAFNFNVFLDATVDPDTLALRLGIQRHELLVIEKLKPTYQNLRIIQVGGFGKLGKERSDSLDQRVQLFQAWLRQKHSDIDFIDWLAFSDFAHFREGRGSNQFINHSTLASLGIPYQNIGALQMEYQTLTGKSPEGEEFQAFVDAHVQEEIVQEVGRLRSHLAPDQDKTFYFVADYDIDFLALELPGVKIELIDVINLCPEAASEGNQTKWGILQALKQLHEQSVKVTSDVVAAAAGISQPYLSKIAKPFGGWKRLEKILLLLLNKLYSVSNIFSSSEQELLDKPESELTDSEYKELKDLEAIKFMATQYLPLAFNEPEIDVPAEVNMVVESFGWKAFEQIVGLMPIQSFAKLLGILINMLPSSVVEEFRGAIAFDDEKMEVTG